ncbi:MAG: gamma-glutamyltransferase [Acidimicrobiia bacterium]
MSVAVAAANQLAADAGAAVAAAGGSAVDAAIAGVLVAALTEPGVCSPAGGGFVTIWGPDAPPVTIDGYLEMPGRTLPPEAFGHGGSKVWMAYGGGMETIVGPGSVATPGGFKALAEASDRFGRLPWAELLQPAIAAARDGFPLSASSDSYLEHALDPIYGIDPRSRAVLTDGDRRLRVGEIVRLPDLADLLDALAEEGVDLLYLGEAGAIISEFVLDGGGILTRHDLAAYETVWRTPISSGLAGRAVATNPGPAVGGAGLVAMLELTKGWAHEGFGPEAATRFAEVQEAVFSYRRRVLDPAVVPDVGELVARARVGDLAALRGSPSTVHVSAAGDDGWGCAITFSAGYGSGCMPPGTGLWLNNSLGEIELNHGGFHSLRPGTRLSSNMAPTLVRGEDSILAIGSPGADRITTAIATTLLAHVDAGLSLEDAVAHPRLHVERTPDGPRVALEPGMPYEGPWASRQFEELHMFFGGVAAAEASPRMVIAASDPRRGGGIAVA